MISPQLRLYLSLCAVAWMTVKGQSSHAQDAVNAPANPDRYREYAMQAEADGTLGRALFENVERTACANCHTIDGTATKAGPDLSGIADKFPKDGLIRAILEPSAEIAVGYANTIVRTSDGEIVSGVVKGADVGWVELMGIEGRRNRISRDKIVEQSTAPTSLMPQGLHGGLSLQEFADLVAYLATLHQKAIPSGGTISADETPLARRGVTFESIFPEGFRLDRPVWFGAIPSKADHYIALEHYGRVVCVEVKEGKTSARTILDLRGIVRPGGASGLLGMAFHPHFAENRKYYLKYQIEDRGQISTLVVERQFSEDLLSDSGAPSRQLFKIPSSTQDHQGGCLEFGPDGFLYFGMGDTGPQEDPQGHGQDMKLLLGKMLRIDVDHPQGDLPYGIPADNPFVNREGIRPEIWAYGFREPWRFTFDAKTHDLWLGDVGQNRFEEVDVVRVGQNYGWNVYEGDNAFSERYRRAGEYYSAPVFSYSHRLGVSVTGGYVYRGKKAAKLEGWYVFADYETRRLWALEPKDGKLARIVEIGRAPSRAVSFTQGSDGELYVVGYDSGVVYHLGLEAVDPRPLVKRVIAETAELKPVTWQFSTESPPSGWFAADFNDSAWTKGTGGFGTRGTPSAVVRTNWSGRDIWLRREFEFADPIAKRDGRSFALRIHHDEDTEVYLNGSKIADLPRWTTGYSEIPIAAECASALKSGRNVIAVHCHQNTGGQYIDVGIIEYVEPPTE